MVVSNATHPTRSILSASKARSARRIKQGQAFNDGWPLLFPAFIEIKNDSVGFAE
jgi:hypothetical protein